MWQRSARLFGRSAVLTIAFLAAVATPRAGAAPVHGPPTDSPLHIVTVPPVPGATFLLDGATSRADADGVATIDSPGSLRDLQERLTYAGYSGDPATEVAFERFSGFGQAGSRGELFAEFSTSKHVVLTFTDLSAETVPLPRITEATLKNSMGVTFTYTGAELEKPVLLPAERVAASPTGPILKSIYYTLQSVTIDGTNTVNKSQQKFFPSKSSTFNVVTQFFQVAVRATDALFGFAAGKAILVRWPNGTVGRYPLQNGRVDLPPLPRGEYQMRVDGAGMVTWRPVTVSRDQTIELKLMSAFDIGTMLGVVVALAALTVLIGRRRFRRTRREEQLIAESAARTEPEVSQV